MAEPGIQQAGGGVAYVQSEQGGSQAWQVGERYELLKVLGEGSFSCVCLALDTKTNEKVAIKRVGDVLASQENAKRVLRECAILRRLNHPNIVALKGLFMHPSSTGRLVFRGGKLVPTSFDLYMVLEYCDQGDLFHMRGQMSELEVQFVMMQLLEVLRYMHACDVWHRDIKSANILIHIQEGRRIAKLCDFGSARSAKASNSNTHANGSWVSPPGSNMEGTCSGRLTGEQDVAQQQQGGGGSRMSFTGDGTRPAATAFVQPASRSSSLVMKGDVSQGGGALQGQSGGGVATIADLYARPTNSARGGFKQPLTRAVCTPCYRAPEVVMSHGHYSSALDVWSLGCVFGEILQRVPYVGKSATPHLQVAPVISVTGEPVTPKDGERFEGPGNPTTCQELAALFAVVGTPAWATIDAVVKHPHWHAYLKNIPGRPGQLFRRFAPAGDAAVDLLARLLEFDPSRRASAAEACEHAYFDSLRREMEMWRLEEAEDLWSQQQQEVDEHHRQLTLQQQQQQQQGKLFPGLPQQTMTPSLQVLMPPPLPALTTTRLGPQGHADSPTSGGLANHLNNQQGGCNVDVNNCMELGEQAPQPSQAAQPTPNQAVTPFQAACRATGGAMSVASDDVGLPPHSLTSSPGAGYADPGQVLAALEQELSSVCVDVGNEGVGTQRLREMLERECEEHTRALREQELQLASYTLALAMAANSEAHSDGEAGTPPALAGSNSLFLPGESGTEGGAAPDGATGGGAAATAGPVTRRGTLAGRHRRRMMGGSSVRRAGLQPDPGNTEDPSQIGKERLPHHRDSEQSGIEPEQHLYAGRHKEWVPTSLPDSLAKTGGNTSWGVTLAPPGMMEGEMDPGMMEAIRQQHAR